MGSGAFIGKNLVQCVRQVVSHAGALQISLVVPAQAGTQRLEVTGFPPARE
jgi:hypothetical protein